MTSRIVKDIYEQHVRDIARMGARADSGSAKQLTLWRRGLGRRTASSAGTLRAGVPCQAGCD